MKKIILCSTTVAGLLVLLPCAKTLAGMPAEPRDPGIQQEKAEHPRIAIAIHELRATIADLQKAPHDFGGHRANAIKASRAAIKQLRLSLEYRENKAGAAPGAIGGVTALPAGLTNSPAYQTEKAVHPQIEWAIIKLNEAMAELKSAPHDFGGHRADAVEACEAAVKQLQLALEFRAQKDANGITPRK